MAIELTAEMQKAAGDVFNQWRAAPLGIEPGTVVHDMLVAALATIPEAAPQESLLERVEHKAEAIVESAKEAVEHLIEGQPQTEPPTA